MTLFISSLSSLLALCHRRSPWSCVVVVLGKGHGDAHPCIPQVCTEASLSLRRFAGSRARAWSTSVSTNEAILLKETPPLLLVLDAAAVQLLLEQLLLSSLFRTRALNKMSMSTTPEH